VRTKSGRRAGGEWTTHLKNSNKPECTYKNASKQIVGTFRGPRTETGRKPDGKRTESGREVDGGMPSARFVLDGVAVQAFSLGRSCRPSPPSTFRPLSVHFPSTFRPLSVRLVWMVLIIIPGHVSDHFWVYKLPAEARLDMLPSTFHPPSFECS
jgi:hypothetical protein